MAVVFAITWHTLYKHNSPHCQNNAPWAEQNLTSNFHIKPKPSSVLFLCTWVSCAHEFHESTWSRILDVKCMPMQEVALQPLKVDRCEPIWGPQHTRRGSYVWTDNVACCSYFCTLLWNLKLIKIQEFWVWLEYWRTLTLAHVKRPPGEVQTRDIWVTLHFAVALVDEVTQTIATLTSCLQGSSGDFLLRKDPLECSTFKNTPAKASGA